MADSDQSAHLASGNLMAVVGLEAVNRFDGFCYLMPDFSPNPSPWTIYLRGPPQSDDITNFVIKRF